MPLSVYLNISEYLSSIARCASIDQMSLSFLFASKGRRGGDDDAELDGKSRIFKSRRIVEKSRENNLFQELLCFQSIKVDGWQKSTI